MGMCGGDCPALAHDVNDIVREDHMDPTHAIDKLGDAHIRCHTHQRKGVFPRQPELCHHEIQHRIEGGDDGLIQRLAEPKGDPSCWGVGAEGVELEISPEDEAKIDQLHACGGFARCTTCRVEFISGEPRKMTQAEKDVLAARGLASCSPTGRRRTATRSSPP